MTWDATRRTAAVTKGTTPIATAMRMRVLIFEAGVSATRVRIRAKSSSGGATSDTNREGVPRSVMIALLPSGCAQSSPELLVGAMSALPHDRSRRSEHRGRRLGAESLLPEEDVRDSVLLR